MNVTIEIPGWATHVVSDLTDMDRDPHPVDATKVSRFTLELPDDVYFEYGFLDANGELRPDPANDRKAENPWYPNASALTGPDYAPDPYATLEMERATGTIDRQRWESDILGQVRRATIYTPEGHERALPTVMVQDGTAYLRVARLPAILQALIDEGEVTPARLVMVEPVDRKQEYGFDETYRRFVLEDVLPRVEERYGEPSELHLFGASLGGLFAVTMALHHPDLIASVVAQSGAFLGTPDDPEFYDNDRSWVLEQFAEGAEPPWRSYTEVGTFEWLTDVNRRVHAHLERTAAPHAYAERHAGHNWVNWRNGIADALRHLLPA